MNCIYLLNQVSKKHKTSIIVMDSGAAKVTTNFTGKRSFGNHRGFQYFSSQQINRKIT